MKKTLIVVDMQNDFIDGSLGTKEAQAIVEPVKKRSRNTGAAAMRSFLHGILIRKIIWRHRRVKSCP